MIVQYDLFATNLGGYMPHQRQFLPDIVPISADDPRMADPEFAARHRKFDAWYSKYQAYNNIMVLAAQHAAKKR